MAKGTLIPFNLRRVDDGHLFVLLMTYGWPEGKLVDVESPDGRKVCTFDEINFYFVDEPDRLMVTVTNAAVRFG